MLFKRRLAQRYVLDSILPYLILSVILLTGALLAQQTTRFAEVIGSARAPLRLASEVFVNLLPNILVFTVPTATLVGVVIGLGRMSSDSELIALRAAGVGTRTVATPVILLGAALSLLTLYLSFHLAPASARRLRGLAAQAALSKFESPVDPRTFYTEMPGKVVFVREGDRESGEWGRVFIYWQGDDGKIRLVTARSGRIDSTAGQAELVLSDAEVVTLQGLDSVQGGQPITSEESSLLRMRDERLDAGRDAILKRLAEGRLEPEEMGWGELVAAVRGAGDTQKGRELAQALHRRLALCLAPFVFALLGVGVGARARRGGRAMGILISLCALIAYYLITVGGGHLGRAGVIPVAFGVWLANVLATACGLLLLSGRARAVPWAGLSTGRGGAVSAAPTQHGATPKGRLGWGIMDRHLIRSLLWWFSGAFALLISVFFIFTVFDLLRYVNNASGWMITRYLFFMLPFAGGVLAPMALLVAVLAAYALMARRSEAIAWWASGQSIYRLSVPGLLFAAAVGGAMWLMQEDLTPQANRAQNSLRAQIRGKVAQAETGAGRQWLATADASRFYTYFYDPAGDRILSPVMFEFDKDGIHLKEIAFGKHGEWVGEKGVVIREAGVITRAGGGGMRVSGPAEVARQDAREVFKPMLNKPAERNFKQLSEDLKLARERADANVPQLSTDLERRRAEPFSPAVLSLIGIPLAFAFGRRSAVMAPTTAVVTGLAFWGLSSALYYLGVRAVLPAVVAAWAPSAIFSAVGVYLLFRART